MKKFKYVLLASHGSEGALAAESAALAICDNQATIKHLIVVPELWKGMMGDDWLNNGESRDRFGRYLESELGREVDEHCDRIRQQVEAHHFLYSSEIVVGDPEKCLVSACNAANYDVVVTGSPRPKGKPGLRSRMVTDNVIKDVKTGIFIAPYPQ